MPLLGDFVGRVGIYRFLQSPPLSREGSFLSLVEGMKGVNMLCELFLLLTKRGCGRTIP